MNKLSLALLFLILVSGTANAGKEGGGSTSVGNGGYAFQCTARDPLRSFDFYKSLEVMGRKFKISPVIWYQGSLLRISALISSKLPALSYSFDKFIQQINNEDPLLQYVWKARSPWMIEPTFVEMGRTTALCKNSSGEHLGFFTQVILRKASPDSQGSAHNETHVTFYYDSSLFGELPEVDQSFLLVHEWLWNFTDDLEANRKADYLLHSTWIEHASSKEVIRQFKKTGIRYP
jgi:hypothetical protein